MKCKKCGGILIPHGFERRDDGKQRYRYKCVNNGCPMSRTDTWGEWK